MLFKKLCLICLAITIQLVSAYVGEECLAHGKNGVCLPITECEYALRKSRLHKVIETSQLIKAIGSHNQPRCGFQNMLEVVCCPKAKSNANKEVGVEGRLAFGIGEVKNQRIADRECTQIVKSYSAISVTRIIGGKTAELGEFPHMAALGYEQYSRYSFRCGGSLISDRYILTAVHCVKNIERIPPSFARLGVLNISDTLWNPDTDYEIEDIFQHPNRSRPKKYHDLAIIRLAKPARMSSLVFPVCLYTNEEDPTITLTVTGWGRTDIARISTSDVLLKAELTIVPRDICNKSHRVSRQLPYGIIDEQLCAVDSSGKMDACQGDSGGPLQGLTQEDAHFRLVGVTSFGNGCASTTPGVYTRVYKYLDWIESIVWPQNQP